MLHCWFRCGLDETGSQHLAAAICSGRLLRSQWAATARSPLLRAGWQSRGGHSAKGSGAGGSARRTAEGRSTTPVPGSSGGSVTAWTTEAQSR